MSGVLTYSARSDVKFEGDSFSVGADSVSCLLTTDDLKSSYGAPKKGQCTIVERINTEWDVKDLIDIELVKKALSRKSTVTKIAKSNSVSEILEHLGLKEIAMVADYNELQAQTFVKGHILNGSLGGPGDNCNLIPMTSSANSSYRHGCEAKLIKLLELAKKAENACKKSNLKRELRVKVKFTARCSGARKPWWGSPTNEFKTMLGKLPAKLIVSYYVEEYFLRDKPNVRVGKSKLDPAEKKHFAKVEDRSLRKQTFEL